MKLVKLRQKTLEVSSGDRLKFETYYMNRFGYDQVWLLECHSWFSKGSTRVMWI